MTKGRITYRLKTKRTYDNNKSVPFKGGGVGKKKK